MALAVQFSAFLYVSKTIFVHTIYVKKLNMSVLSKKWKYINEGNLHIVLCVIDTNYVIRLIKEDGYMTKMETIRNSVDFVNLVMIPLLFGKKVYYEEIIQLSIEDVAELSEKLSSIRPKHRQVKSIFSHFAIRAPNLTTISNNCENYCIEIKPKEGFICSHFKRYSKCYYCLKQFLKLQEKQIDSTSNYCPLDLFSGEKIRMKRALLNLIKNPQNNFKFFKDGSIIYSEESKNDFETLITKLSIFRSINIFLDFIIDILLSDGTSNIILYVSDGEINLKTGKCYEGSNLKPDSFLNKLLILQMLSETFLDLTNESEDFEYVSKLLYDMQQLNMDLSKLDDRERFLESMNPKYLALISAVAKDCSIMICFSPNSHKSCSSVKIGDKSISYKLSVTDLEPKSMKSLTKRKNTEKKLTQLYEKMN